MELKSEYHEVGKTKLTVKMPFALDLSLWALKKLYAGLDLLISSFDSVVPLTRNTLTATAIRMLAHHLFNTSAMTAIAQVTCNI